MKLICFVFLIYIVRVSGLLFYLIQTELMTGNSKIVLSRKKIPMINKLKEAEHRISVVNSLLLHNLYAKKYGELKYDMTDIYHNSSFISSAAIYLSLLQLSPNLSVDLTLAIEHNCVKLEDFSGKSFHYFYLRHAKIRVSKITMVKYEISLIYLLFLYVTRSFLKYYCKKHSLHPDHLFTYSLATKIKNYKVIKSWGKKRRKVSEIV